MKIAILNCLRANEVCAGCACLNAFNARAKSFEIYRDTEVELAAFLRCNGCRRGPGLGDGMVEKLERLKSEGVEAVHLGFCTRGRNGAECRTITRMAEILESWGLRVVRGTH